MRSSILLAILAVGLSGCDSPSKEEPALNKYEQRKMYNAALVSECILGRLEREKMQDSSWNYSLKCTEIYHD